MKHNKRFILIAVLVLLAAFSLSACGSGNSAASSTFPNIQDDDIPDILEKTVGTVGDTYFSSNITDNEDYRAILSVTFENTTEDDYQTLLAHYQSDSTGTDENGALLFDWGQLQVTALDDNAIQINGYIK